MDPTQKKNLRIGYCCLNVKLRSLGIFTSRTCRLETIRDRGIEYSYELAHKNLDDLAAIFRWNYQHRIYVYRMSSEMFPFATHPDYEAMYDITQFGATLSKLGQLAKEYKQRLTFHPGQHCVLASKSETVVRNAVLDVNFHAKILDMMDVNGDGVIVLHGGSKQDGIQQSLERLKSAYALLSESAKQRLTLENCETMFSVENLIPISEELKIPIILDFHHHNINPGSTNLSTLIESVLRVWDQRSITPLFHLSESKPGVKVTDNILLRRAHSDYVSAFPSELLEAVKHHRIDLDIEAKQKDKAVQRLYEIYSM
jgi:UV DNA damage endonuclease